MGNPAARVADMTGHGGVIMPPGVPTVLIGGMPAATITSMHVCPMITVLVPHVGGPVLPPGVPTVLIGGLPAAVVGDMATCVGPPDTIIPPGCPTVLIGSGGGGGGGGGAAAGAAKAGAYSALAGEPGPETEGPHWIECKFEDSAGNPVTGVHYELEDLEGKKTRGILTGDGAIRRGGLPNEGEYKIKIFSVFNAQWSTDSAKVGDVVKLSAEVEGFEDGTEAVIEIWEQDIGGADDFIKKIEASVDDGKIEAEWEYEYIEDDDDVTVEDERKGYSAPEYYFFVKVEDQRARSGVLEYKDWIEIKLLDQDDQGIANEEYILYFPDGAIRNGKLDGNGYKKEENIPPGKCFVKFPAWDNVTDVK